MLPAYQSLARLIKGAGPREKMLSAGPSALRDFEHLAVIFGTGYKQESVLELASRVLADYGAKAILKARDVGEVMQLAGLPTVKACQLLSALELGRRFFAPEFSSFPTIRTPADAYRIFRPMAGLKKETLEALYLNVKNRVIHRETISVGVIDRTFVEPAEIYEPAIACRALGVIIAHNHPSGDCTPSEQDRSNTERIQKAGAILGKPLLDHLVIGRNGFRSVLQNG